MKAVSSCHGLGMNNIAQYWWWRGRRLISQTSKTNLLLSTLKNRPLKTCESMNEPKVRHQRCGNVLEKQWNCKISTVDKWLYSVVCTMYHPESSKVQILLQKVTSLRCPFMATFQEGWGSWHFGSDFTHFVSLGMLQCPTDDICKPVVGNSNSTYNFGQWRLWF